MEKQTKNCDYNIDCPSCMSVCLSDRLFALVCSCSKKIKETIFWLSLLMFWGSVPSYVSRGLFVSSRHGVPLLSFTWKFVETWSPSLFRDGAGVNKREEFASFHCKLSSQELGVCLSVCQSVFFSVCQGWATCCKVEKAKLSSNKKLGKIVYPKVWIYKLPIF